MGKFMLKMPAKKFM
jgi:hypothetical protein